MSKTPQHTHKHHPSARTQNTGSFGTLLVLRLSPWWTPQYLIPTLGMVLGNTITGISIGLATILEELSSGVL